MIITKPRDWARIRANLDEHRARSASSSWAAASARPSRSTGGEKETAGRQGRARGRGLRGHRLGRRRGGLPLRAAPQLESRKHFGDIDAADAVLVLACGAGVQTVADAVDEAGLPRARERVPRQRGAPRRVRGALPDVRRLRARPDRRHLPGHDLPEGAAQRPVRRDVGRQVRGADATASARTSGSASASPSRAGAPPRSCPPRTTRRS